MDAPREALRIREVAIDEGAEQSWLDFRSI
jgi:hypothetical protein